MPDSQGRFRSISVPDVPWHRSEPWRDPKTDRGLKDGALWSQYRNEDGTLVRVYHEPDGDRRVIMDPRRADT